MMLCQKYSFLFYDLIEALSSSSPDSSYLTQEFENLINKQRDFCELSQPKIFLTKDAEAEK